MLDLPALTLTISGNGRLPIAGGRYQLSNLTHVCYDTFEYGLTQSCPFEAAIDAAFDNCGSLISLADAGRVLADGNSWQLRADIDCALFTLRHGGAL